mmetsp:Transcript_120803/g.352867  ORF Transcript_120803/g.352867 Transcript_120803/m.352867 type:complete len:275 (+) Transcript_120803:765-1589(+)
MSWFISSPTHVMVNSKSKMDQMRACVLAWMDFISKNIEEKPSLDFSTFIILNMRAMRAVRIMAGLKSRNADVLSLPTMSTMPRISSNKSNHIQPETKAFVFMAPSRRMNSMRKRLVKTSGRSLKADAAPGHISSADSGASGCSMLKPTSKPMYCTSSAMEMVFRRIRAEHETSKTVLPTTRSKKGFCDMAVEEPNLSPSNRLLLYFSFVEVLCGVSASPHSSLSATGFTRGGTEPVSEPRCPTIPICHDSRPWLAAGQKVVEPTAAPSRLLISS